MATEPRISLCMVVKDEAERLPRCLEAARPYVDEIVVVDTGSTDDTIRLAEDGGARVFEMPWTDDFSIVRNRSMDEASGDWCLILDADEVLSSSAGRELRRAAAQSEVMAIYFPLRNAYGKGKEITTLMLRAVRNRPDIRYCGRIHEQFVVAARDRAQEEGKLLVNATGEIFHDGYLPDVMEERKKNDRNRRLFELQLADEPDDLYTIYRFADFLRRFDDRDSRDLAFHHLDDAYERLRDLDDAGRRNLTFGAEVCALHAIALVDRGEATEAREVCEFGLAECNVTPNLLYVHGQTCLEAGDAETAAQSFTECMTYHGQALVMPAQPGITGRLSRIGLARALLAKGKVREASAQALKIVEEHPDDVDALGLWVDVESALGHAPEVLEELMKRARTTPSNAALWHKGGELLFRMRMFDKAIPWLMRASEMAEDPGPPLGILGECLLSAGHVEPAIDAFGRGYPHSHCRAGLLLVSLTFGIEPEVAADLDDAALRRDFTRMVCNLRLMGESRILRRLHEEARQLESSDPACHAFLEEALCQFA